MNIKNILLGIAIAGLLSACGGGDYSPKPQAYLRIDLPEHEYFLLDTMRTYPGDTLVFDGDTAIALSGFTKTFPFPSRPTSASNGLRRMPPRANVGLTSSIHSGTAWCSSHTTACIHPTN